jgi:PAS domain S-box-containing protein
MENALETTRNNRRVDVTDMVDDFRDFFEHAGVGMQWLGPDGVILRVNQAGLHMLGYARDQYVGHHFSEFCIDPGVGEDLLFRLMSGNAVQQYEARFRCKDEAVKDVLISANALWQGNDFVRARFVMLDITGRKRWEMSQAELAAIVESSEDAIIIEALDGTVVGWNASATRLFGYTASQAIGELVTLLMPIDRPNREPDILAHFRTGRRIKPFETVRRRKDGELIPVSISISPIKDEKGQIIGAAQTIRDITEIKQVEADLRDKILDLETFHDVVVGRELKMIELEEELKKLREQLGGTMLEHKSQTPALPKIPLISNAQAYNKI